MLRGVLSVFVASFVLLARSSSAQSINSTLGSIANTTFFASALADAGLSTQFSNTSLNLTLLVPNDAAFAQLEITSNITGDLFFLPSSASKAAAILLYHYVSPAVLTGNIPSNISTLPLAYTSGTLRFNNSIVPTNTSLGGSNFTIVNTTVIRVTGIGSDANITRTANVSAGGSVIHVIDNVLLPYYISIASGFSRNSNLSSLNKLATVQLNNTALLSVLNNINSAFTVLAPVNTAFNNPSDAVNATLTALLNSTAGFSYFLNYHLIPNQVFLQPSAFFNATLNQTVRTVTTAAGPPITLVKEGSTVTIITPNGNATILASYSVSITNSGSYRSAIHLISQALVPPVNPTVRSIFATRNDTNTIVSVIGNSSSYASLLDDTTLRRTTIFAPTDAAFNTLCANYNYTLQQFISGSLGVRQLLGLLVIQQSSPVSLAALPNGISNITVTDGTVVLRANKSSSNTVKLLSLNVAATGSSANTLSNDYWVGSFNTSSGVTVIVIDTVLLPAVFNMGAGGGAWLALPSPLMLLLSSFLGLAALQLLSRQDQ